MSVGVLTRESVRRALSVGITANQIIDYLRTNAHDQMLKEVRHLTLTAFENFLFLNFIESDPSADDNGSNSLMGVGAGPIYFRRGSALFEFHFWRGIFVDEKLRSSNRRLNVGKHRWSHDGRYTCWTRTYQELEESESEGIQIIWFRVGIISFLYEIWFYVIKKRLTWVHEAWVLGSHILKDK